MTKTLEIIIIENNTEVIHRSVSNVDDYANPYTTAISVIVDSLTGANIRGSTAPKVKPTPNTDKFAAAVPDYKPEPVAFHPDLVKEGVVSKPKPVIDEKNIPTIKLDMKTILKGAK